MVNGWRECLIDECKIKCVERLKMVIYLEKGMIFEGVWGLDEKSKIIFFRTSFFWSSWEFFVWGFVDGVLSVASNGVVTVVLPNGQQFNVGVDSSIEFDYAGEGYRASVVSINPVNGRAAIRLNSLNDVGDGLPLPEKSGLGIGKVILWIVIVFILVVVVFVVFKVIEVRRLRGERADVVSELVGEFEDGVQRVERDVGLG
jgi:hypothetical protein